MKQKVLIVIVLIAFFVIIIGYKLMGKREFGVDDSAKPKTQTLSLGKAIPCADCNVVILSVEPLRTKNMSLYGYNKKTTPNLNKFFKDALVFDNFVSVSPWTLPAHMSLFTGVYPSRHKITNKIGITEDGGEFANNLIKVSPDLKTITQILKANGYKTAGFTGGAADAASFGFDLGFDNYVDDGDFVGLSANMSKVEDWITKNKNQKFFLFLQGYDVHGQYIPKGGYDKRFVDFDYKGNLTGSKDEQKDLREEGITRGEIFLTTDDVRFLTALYDEKIQRMDENIGSFFDYLDQLGLLDKTIVIFLSGHGEELYEHGRIDHGHSLYEELIHVPLMMKIPGYSKEVRVESQFSIIDIMPTVFDLLGKDTLKDLPENLDGKSIFQSLKNGVDDKNVLLETDYRYSVFKRGIRTDDGWKMVRDLETGQTQLFDINHDPQEKDDLSVKNADKLNQILPILHDQIKKY